MHALTIFAGPICFTLTQRDEGFIWLFSILILWPSAVSVIYVVYRLVLHFIKKNKQPKSKLKSTLEKLTLSTYGLTVLLVVASILNASKKIIDGGYNSCGIVVTNELSNVLIKLALVVFLFHVLLLIACLLEPFFNKNKKYK